MPPLVEQTIWLRAHHYQRARSFDANLSRFMRVGNLIG